MRRMISRIVKGLKRGKVILCPTDTVYGLVADSTNKRAVEKIFKIKNRPKNKPLPIFIRNLRMARELAEIDKEQERFLKKAWPGKVTAVLKKKTKKPNRRIYGVDRKTIALRIPNYKLVLDLIKKINRPLTGTSANISRKPPSTKVKEVLRQFKEEKYLPDLIINAGNLPKNKPSLVIDLTKEPPKILRP
jgi:L-threonylcarbamoyladenylate synthase